jgi:hypothetical protein
MNTTTMRWALLAVGVVAVSLLGAPGRMAAFALASTVALIIVGKSVVGPRLARPAGYRDGEGDDDTTDAYWAPEWERRDA